MVVGIIDLIKGSTCANKSLLPAVQGLLQLANARTHPLDQAENLDGRRRSVGHRDARHNPGRTIGVTVRRVSDLGDRAGAHICVRVPRSVGNGGSNRGGGGGRRRQVDKGGEAGGGR